MTAETLTGIIIGMTLMAAMWLVALIYGPPYLDKLSDEDENDGENDND